MSEISTSIAIRSYYSRPSKTARWFNVKKGMKMHIMTQDEIVEHFGSLEGVGSFYQYQIAGITEKVLGKKFTINQAMLDRINACNYESSGIYFPIIERSRIDIPLKMFIIDDESIENFPKEEENTDILKYDIKIENKDPEIIKEMISKVDKENLKKMMSLPRRNYESNVPPISDDVVDKYLQLWAENKYEYYLMFDKNLFVKKDIDLVASEVELAKKVDDLLYNYDIYTIMLRNFTTEDFINNVCPKNEMLSNLTDHYVEGMKLSKFLSSYFNDVKFDIDYSKILQNKRVKTSMFVSIDPCDFITVSINNHNWKSCHNAVDGLFKTAGYSLMLDEASLVGFIGKDTKVEYNYIQHEKFMWNSKQARLMINIDKNTGAMSFNKPYPNMSKETCSEFRYLMEEIMSKYLGIKNEWYCSDHDTNNLQGSINASGNFHYTDPIYYIVMPSTMQKTTGECIRFNIGNQFIYCLECGEKMFDSNFARQRNVICKDCEQRIQDKRLEQAFAAV